MERNVDNIRYLYSDSAWYEDNQIWVSSMEFNGLYQYNINSNRIKFIGSFPNEASYVRRLHSKALKIKNEIYFFPDWSKYVHVYNIETSIISAYRVGLEGRVGTRNSVYYEGRIYFICGGTEILVCSIDIATKEVEKRKIEVENYRYGISSDSVLVKDKLYFVCQYPNVVVEYSCGDGICNKYQIGKNEERFGTICYDGEAFWLSGNVGIVRWKRDSSEIKKYNNFPDRFGMCIRPSLDSNQIEFIKGFTNKYSETEQPFGFSAFFGGKVWLFPGRTNMIICVDIQTGYMEEFCLEGEQEDEASLLAKYRYTHCHYLGGMQNKTLIFFSTKSKKVRVISQNGKIEVKEFYLRSKEPDDIFSYLGGKNLGVRHEDEDFNSLEEFLAINPKRNIDNIYNKKNVGTLIYEAVKGY